MKIGAALACLLGWGCTAPPAPIWLTLELPEELRGKAEFVEVEPRSAETGRKLGRGALALELRRQAGRVQLSAPGACPLALETQELAKSAEPRARLSALFELGGSERVVGLEQLFEIHARGACPEAAAAEGRLSVTGGAPLLDVSVSSDGRTLRGKTAGASELDLSISTAWGIVPVAARVKERARSEVTFSVRLPSGASFSQNIGISSVARASGLPNIALDHPVLLQGTQFSLSERPAGSRATLRSLSGSLFEFVPDVEGVYKAQDLAGRSLSLKSGRYDETPLDCGRSDCHRELAQSAQKSPMTLALESDLGGCHSLSQPECASACHATGEPGTRDGGFSHVTQELGLGALPEEHADLPRALRRLGGVGCLACHGPGAVPEPTGRWAILRSDVCAVCHDAPPRYGHVAALATSGMAHADSDPQVRANPACARCHTSWGALGRPAPPAVAPAMGLGCATCHDVHPHGPVAAVHSAPHATRFAEPALLRNLPLPQSVPDPPAAFSGPSRVCIGCHSPSGSELAPEASAAALIAGRGGILPASGEALVLPPIHATSPRGCLSCHDSGPAGIERGKGHAFQATEASCGPCHQQQPPRRNPELARRARLLFTKLTHEKPLAPAGRPQHAEPAVSPTTPERARALRNILLVLEDPAADVHHPAYAEALLDSAERFTHGASP